MEDVKVSKADCTTSGSGQFKCSDSSQSSFFKHCSKTFKTSCILSCCNSCSVCNFKRASAKERYKTRGEKDRNKTCQRCFFCKSLSFCQTCSKCPQCHQRVGCRGETTDLLAKVARARCKPQGSLHFEGGLCPTFKMRPPLTRFPLITSGYANPVRSRALSEALAALREKLVVEKVVVRTSLSFYNRLFLVPKPNKKWRPILDLSQLNLYLQTNTFKMETPETIRVSLQKGEWVTSLDFSDAYFHIPIHPRSRKYLRFFLNSKAYQFTALPFGLATAPLEFTKVVKEVKLLAQTRGIRIHQYLDDWLLRAPCPETCQRNTQTLLALCRELGWVVNLEKSELVPQQVFNFVGYRFDLLTGRVLPTSERWETLRAKLLFVKNRDSCTVRQFMSS